MMNSARMKFQRQMKVNECLMQNCICDSYDRSNKNTRWFVTLFHTSSFDSSLIKFQSIMSLYWLYYLICLLTRTMKQSYSVFTPSFEYYRL